MMVSAPLRHDLLSVLTRDITNQTQTDLVQHNTHNNNDIQMKFGLDKCATTSVLLYTLSVARSGTTVGKMDITNSNKTKLSRRVFGCGRE